MVRDLQARVRPHAVETERSSALASIGYKSLLLDGATSSDDDGEIRRIPTEEARVLDVSIGREQTRLASPKTPAIEKAAALERAHGFFGDGAGDEEDIPVEDPEVAAAAADTPLHDGGYAANVGDIDQGQTHDGSPGRHIVEAPLPEADERLPSPWRAEPRKFERSAEVRQSLQNGLYTNRRRASSGPEVSWSRSLISSLPSLPSMPKNFSFTSPFSSLQGSNNDSIPDRKRQSLWASFSRTSEATRSTSALTRYRSASGSKSARRLSSPQEAEEARATVGALPTRPELQILRSRTSRLRRSASDDSLTTARTLSRVSSLGDDSRFENVSDQVNSRLKAIRDSLQDSSIKLPSMPSIAGLRADFLRDRADSNAQDRSLPSDGSTSRPQPVDPFTRQPYRSAKEIVSDSKPEAMHPNFNRALSHLEGDVVVLGGYRGSILRSAQAPHRQLWVPIKVGLNIRKVDLEVGLNPEDDELATQKVIPGGMLTHIGPVDISRRLLKRLRRCENALNGKLRVHEYGYDWRLDPNHLSRQLQQFLWNLDCNHSNAPAGSRGATVIAHSLGGLITRHAINQQPSLVNGVVFAGVPKTCVNILGPMRNGDDVLLSSRVLTAQVNFTIRTSYALLPLDGRCFIDKNTGEEYPIDFFDPQTWADNRLSPCMGRPLPSRSKAREPAGISGYMSSMAKALPSLSLPSRKNSLRNKTSPPDQSATAGLEPGTGSAAQGGSATTEANHNIDSGDHDSEPTSISTTVTIPRADAIAYLTRTLASVKSFKQQLAHVPAYSASNRYPPMSLIYGKSTPTVYGAKIDGREGMKHADAYDELAFASGDGVVLARAAMLPEGYNAARGGIIVTLTLIYFTATSLAIACLSYYSRWIRHWALSGAAVETVLLLYPLEFSPKRWTLLACVNLAYLSLLFLPHSRSLYRLVAAACWIFVIITAMLQAATVLWQVLYAAFPSLAEQVNVFGDRLIVLDLPVLVLDFGVIGSAYVRGITGKLHELRLICHGIEISFTFGFHEISIYCDALEIKIFRKVLVNELYIVHNEASSSQVDTASKSVNGDQDAKSTAPFDPKLRATEASCEQILSDLRKKSRLVQCCGSVEQMPRRDPALANGELERRALISAELRKLPSVSVGDADVAKLSSLWSHIAPISRLFNAYPTLLRVLLMPVTSLHAVEIQAIYVAASAKPLHKLLVDKFFGQDETRNKHVEEFEQEVASWLSPADFCLDFNNVVIKAFVPIRVTNEISGSIGASETIVTRVETSDSIDKVIRLKATRATFSSPAFLLPYHSYLVPPPPNHSKAHTSESQNPDTFPLRLSTHLTLPAKFSHAFLTFITQLSKTSQIQDIQSTDDGMPDARAPSASEVPQECSAQEDSPSTSLGHRMKEKIKLGKASEVIKRPGEKLKGVLHKGTKIMAVKQVDGGWFATWTNKLLDQLEWMEGEIGYSYTVPVELGRFRKV
ncbi:hypothetical protein B0A48_09959 [Cryoendolithus antarcticus]|uniref:Uncharacterized protein n=1 Tax=Cryoendolithus antarcticus TaxID=1507870 RepID=A0A1V8T3I8_9PEZI|nr:hypothetical protein B0A48_09959 [Cryoendolithus antarcticus]